MNVSFVVFRKKTLVSSLSPTFWSFCFWSHCVPWQCGRRGKQPLMPSSLLWPQTWVRRRPASSSLRAPLLTPLYLLNILWVRVYCVYTVFYICIHKCYFFILTAQWFRKVFRRDSLFYAFYASVRTVVCVWFIPSSDTLVRWQGSAECHQNKLNLIKSHFGKSRQCYTLQVKDLLVILWWLASLTVVLHGPEPTRRRGGGAAEWRHSWWLPAWGRLGQISQESRVLFQDSSHLSLHVSANSNQAPSGFCCHLFYMFSCYRHCRRGTEFEDGYGDLGLIAPIGEMTHR